MSARLIPKIWAAWEEGYNVNGGQIREEERSRGKYST